MSELLLINPRRRRVKSRRRRKGRMPRALAAYWASRRGGKRRRRKVHARRRRRSRAIGHVQRRIRRRKLNPRRAHARTHSRRIFTMRRRRRHRNPRFGIPSVRGVMRQTLMPAAIGATGALALDVAYGYAQPYLPAMLQGKWPTLAVKVVGALGIGMLASKFLGRERGRIATLGAVTVVGYGALKSALSQALPTLPGLSGYQDFVDYSARGNLGFYSPAATIPPSGTGAYLPAPAMGAYIPPGLHGLEGVDGYNWQNDGM